MDLGPRTAREFFSRGFREGLKIVIQRAFLIYAEKYLYQINNSLNSENTGGKLDVLRKKISSERFESLEAFMTFKIYL